MANDRDLSDFEIRNALYSKSNADRGKLFGVNQQKLFAEIRQYFAEINKQALEFAKQRAEELLKEEEKLIDKRSLKEQMRINKRKQEECEALDDIAEYDVELSEEINKRKEALILQQHELERKQYEISKKAFLEAEKFKADIQRKKAKKDSDKPSAKERMAGYEASKERLEELTKQLSEAIANGNEKLVESIKDEMTEIVKSTKNQDKINSIIKGIDSVTGAVNRLSNGVQNSLNSLYDEQVRFNSRTTSANDAYGSMIEDISNLIGTSWYVKQSDVIKNLSEIANTGSNYNIEQRAYLATLAKDIASTFDATQPELLRLNRLLHTDLTSVMMGMEQNLTSALNNTFNDSSFMNNLRDAVASGVLDAQSQLSSGQGTDFAWAVQTWMGALTSAGVSDDVISMLTQGLNYLGSGNVSAMSGNEQLQTLFALASSRGTGKSYSEMLVDGIDASDVNSLMSEMITYLKEISDENKVVQSEYFRILGLGGLSNMTALNNIDVAEVLNIAQNSKTGINTGYYSTSSLLNRVNVIKENIMTTLATDIGESLPRLVAWETANLLQDLVGGVSIPTVSVLGSYVDIKSTVADIMKAGVLISDIFGVAGSIATSIRNKGIADFGAFQEQAGGITTGFGTSLSYAVGSSSSSDVMKSSITSQVNTAKKNKKTISDASGEKEEDSAEKQLKSIRDNVESMKTSSLFVVDKFNKMFEKFDDDVSPIKVENKELSKLTSVLSPDRVQKVEGTVTLAGFGTDSEKTLNDVLTNAIALAIKMIIGGATSPGANEMTMEGGMMGGEYMGRMSLMEFLTHIIESNSQTQAQISNTLDYFTQQRDTSYIR